jgi:hypothetical protein
MACKSTLVHSIIYAGYDRVPIQQNLSLLLAMCCTILVACASNAAGQALYFFLNTDTVIPELKSGCQPCNPG